MQNPSDAEATYDGHKGPGYQVQIAETCSSQNEVQLITAALPQTACEADEGAAVPMLDQLKKADLLPETMLGDTLYTNDENVQAAAGFGVDLIGPVPGRLQDSNAEALTIDDFAVDERSGIVGACPAGHQPLSCTYDEPTGKTKLEMAAGAWPHVSFGANARSSRLMRDATFWSTPRRSVVWPRGVGNKKPMFSSNSTRCGRGSSRPTAV